MRLNAKVAMITGAASGIGLATAQRFAREGARVVLADLDPADLGAALDEVRASVPDPLPDDVLMSAVIDVTDRLSLDAMVAEVCRRWGRIDILVNNAGITADARFHQMTEAQFDRVIAVNLKGVWHATQAVVPTFMAQGSGVVLSASSVVGLTGNFGQTNYAASKAGVIGMTRTWARELGPKGIRCVAVCPGLIDTPMLETIPAAVLEKLLDKVPLHRLGKPEEVAAVYAFLGSDDAAYINGAVIEVSGGIML